MRQAGAVARAALFRLAALFAVAAFFCLVAPHAWAGSPGDAIAGLQRSLTAAEERLGLTSPDLLPVLGALAQRRYQNADIDEALALRRRSLKIAVAAFGADSAPAAEAMTALASLYIQLQRYLDAEPLLIVAEAALTAARGPEDPAMAPVLTGRSVVALARGDKRCALEWAERAVAIDEKNELKPTSGPLRALGAALAAAERYRESEDALRRAVALDRGGEGEDGLATARSVAQLGNLYLRRKRFAEALPLLEDAARIDQSRLGPGHPGIADDFYGIGVAYLEAGRAGAAARVLRHAIDLTDRGGVRNAPSAAYLRLALARAEHELGRDDEARAQFAEAQRILDAAEDAERGRERQI